GVAGMGVKCGRMRVVALHAGALSLPCGDRSGPERSGRAPAAVVTRPSSPTQRLLEVALLAALAGCSVKLPSPPTTTSEAQQRCVLECQAQHIRCLQSLGSSKSSQRRCADYLGTCYEGSCKGPSQTEQ